MIYELSYSPSNDPNFSSDKPNQTAAPEEVSAVKEVIPPKPSPPAVVQSPEVKGQGELAVTSTEVSGQERTLANAEESLMMPPDLADVEGSYIP